MSVVLRPYQAQCVDSIFTEFEEHSSTLAVLATGLGKSVIMAEVARRMLPKRTLFVAHRSELIHQMRDHLRRLGLDVEIEMAGYQANASMFQLDTAIVASVQTLISGIESKRMEKFRPDDFGLLLCDEFHHGTSASYRMVFDYFKKNPDLKLLGVTATPDRSDEEALGQIVETVAFEYEVPDAIQDGWLCDIDQQMVHITGLDFSSARTTAGDLNGADLAAIMEDEKNLQGMCGATHEIIGNKKTLVFTSSVRHAEQCHNIFERFRPGSSAWIHGKMPEDDRNHAVKQFRNSTKQILVNCAIATEGFDVPDVEVVVIGRPTKSRSLYSQMIGRGTRPLPRTVDGIENAEDRRAAIAASDKPKLIVLDFAGNAGRHKLVSVTDILGGKYSEEVVALAERKISQGGPVRVSEALKAAQREIQEKIERAKRDEEARKARLRAQVQFVVKKISPFDAFDLVPARERGWDKNKQLSPKQKAILQKMGVDPETIPYAQGKQLLAEQFRRWSDGLCTTKQAMLLKKHGYEPKDMTMKEASELIDQLAKNGWRRIEEVAA